MTKEFMWEQVKKLRHFLTNKFFSDDWARDTWYKYKEVPEQVFEQAVAKTIFNKSNDSLGTQFERHITAALEEANRKVKEMLDEHPDLTAQTEVELKITKTFTLHETPKPPAHYPSRCHKCHGDGLIFARHKEGQQLHLFRCSCLAASRVSRIIDLPPEDLSKFEIL